MAMRLFDTHAHLGDERFDADRDAVCAGLSGAGVELVLDVCCDVEAWENTGSLLARYPFIYGAVGMHPHEAGKITQAHLERVAALYAQEKVVAIGEIGLDYHYDFAPREVQRAWFGAQLELAKALDAPVVLHIREAFGDCMDILRAHKQGLRGEMHCFSGSTEIARECLDMGLYIAFGGAVTFHNANKLLDAARYVPTDRLLVETDCPYMTPAPHRGARNTPAYVGLVCARLAELRGADPEEIAAATLQNGCELFGIRLSPVKKVAAPLF